MKKYKSGLVNFFGITIQTYTFYLSISDFSRTSILRIRIYIKDNHNNIIGTRGLNCLSYPLKSDVPAKAIKSKNSKANNSDGIDLHLKAAG